MIRIHDELSLPFFTLLPPQVIKIEVKQVRAPKLIVFPLGSRSLVALLLKNGQDEKTHFPRCSASALVNSSPEYMPRKVPEGIFFVPAKTPLIPR